MGSGIIIPIMSTLAEIESAIEGLPAPQLDELALWIERRRSRPAAPSAAEPDFLARAKSIGARLLQERP